jgi:uridine kinase
MQTVFISGGSASGKSWFAKRLIAALSARGHKATLLSQDCFYCDRPESVDGTDRHHFDFDRPEAIDWQSMAQAIRSLKNGEDTLVPVYDFNVSKRSGVETLRPEGRLLIVDGTLILHAAKLRALADVAMYIRAPEALRQHRRLARDTVERGRDPDDILRQLSTQVFPAHNEFVRPSADYADQIFEAETLLVAPDAALEDALALIRL